MHFQPPPTMPTNVGSKERPASFRVKTASWATTMLYSQPTLCPLHCASLCFMDPEPLRKLLSNTKVFASRAALFAAALLLGATQEFMVFCMEIYIWKKDEVYAS